MIESPRAGILAVLSGCGGAGGSSFAAVLAAVAARSGPAVLLDLDDRGGGIDLLLGAETESGPRWSDVRVAGGGLDPDLLAATLPRWQGVSFLAADPDGLLGSMEVSTVVDAASVVGTTILDVPRWPCDARDVALGCADLAVVVVPAEVRAIGASSVLMRDLDRDRAAVVVRGADRRLPSGRVAEQLGAPLLGDLHFDPAMSDPVGLAWDRVHRATVRMAQVALESLRSRRHSDRQEPETP